MGADQAKKFDHLAANESKQKLAEIADKMDANHDGLVNLDELQRWIDQAQKSYMQRDLDKQWRTHNPSEMEKLSWEEYRLATYSFLDNPDISGLSEEDQKMYESMEQRDRKRWKLADQDDDQLLTKQEFLSLLHPEHSQQMKQLVVDETLEDLDKDRDGRVSLSEYIRDLYELDDGKTVGEDEPDWVQTERRHFNEYRDKNGDGYLDRDEMKEWLMPVKVHSEAEHLIEEADRNGDAKLSKEEILDSYDLFVGSEATEYGEALAANRHDELWKTKKVFI